MNTPRKLSNELQAWLDGRDVRHPNMVVDGDRVAVWIRLSEPLPAGGRERLDQAGLALDDDEIDAGPVSARLTRDQLRALAAAPEVVSIGPVGTSQLSAPVTSPDPEDDDD